MLKSLVRWGLFTLALVVAGPIAWLATGRLHGPDGGATTPILSTTPVIGLLLAVGAVGLATLVGMATARLVSVHSAFLDAGIILTWAAFGTGEIGPVARSSQTAALAWRLAAEGAVLALAGAAAAWLICRAGAVHLAPTAPPAPATRAGRDDGGSLVPGLLTAGVALVGALAGAWLVAQNQLKGQTIAAAAIGGMVGAALALVANHRSHQHLILIGVFAGAWVAPVLGALIHGSAPDKGFLAAASTGTKLIRFAGVMPMDWLAGGFMGVPMGISLGSWLTDGRKHRQPSPATA